MAITKRINKEKIDEAISKGGHVSADNKKNNAEWRSILLRIPNEMIDEIGLIIKEKRKGMNRNAWILEAIQEKFRRESI